MSCLFHALRGAGDVKEGSAEEMRLRLVKYIEENAEKYKEHIQHEYNGATVEEYCEKMAKPFTLGDYIMVCAAANVYHWRIIISFPLTPTKPNHVLEPTFFEPIKTVPIKWVPGHWSA